MLDEALATAQAALNMGTPEGDADALSTCDEILQMQMDNPHAMHMAGMSLYRMKQYGLASILLNTASQLNPGDAALWNNLGICMRENHPHDAVFVLRKALEVDPTHIQARKNLAALLGHTGKRDEAIEINTKLLEECPDDPDVPYNLALDLLHTDKWDEAFAAYVYSEGNNQRKVRNYHNDKQTPRWDGKSSGKIVIYGEQGVGDEILAASAYNDLKAKDRDIVIECDARLEGLFRRSFPWATVHGTRYENILEWPSHFDADACLIGMAAFGMVAKPEKKVEPWLTPDADQVEYFKTLLAKYGDGPKIGLSWTGGAKAWQRAHRSIPIEELGPILATPNATIVSLEYKDGPKPDGVIDLPWATRKGVDMDTTAALIAALDMVVSVPQTVCDVAGAVGTPLKALVSEKAPWRFTEAAGDAWIWKDVKTYRKKPGGNWMPVVAKCARDIREGL